MSNVTTVVKIGVAVVMVVCQQTVAAESGALAEPFEMEQVTTTWRHLANERVVFPLDMKDMPVKIGRWRQLFLDNYLIAKAEHVTREVQRPQRYKKNPILTPHMPETEDLEYRAVAQHVLQFETSPRFRMWYQSYPAWHDWGDHQQIRFASGYAVSDDGVNWSKPNLDLHKIKGSALRNIVIPYGLMHGVFYDPHDSDPQKRFKALVCVEARRVRDGKLTREYTIPEGYYLHWSPRRNTLEG